MTVYFMSTTVIPTGAVGVWHVHALSPEMAQAYAENNQEFAISAVGHSSTAEAMSAALGITVRENRFTVVPEEGDEFLCFRLLSRPVEGAILNRETLEQVGYEWVLMIYSSSEEPLI